MAKAMPFCHAGSADSDGPVSDCSDASARESRTRIIHAHLHLTCVCAQTEMVRKNWTVFSVFLSVLSGRVMLLWAAVFVYRIRCRAFGCVKRQQIGIKIRRVILALRTSRSSAGHGRETPPVCRSDCLKAGLEQVLYSVILRAYSKTNPI